MFDRLPQSALTILLGASIWITSEQLKAETIQDAKINADEGRHLLSENGDRQLIVLNRKEGSEILCIAPQPDLGMTQSEGVSLGSKVAINDDKTGIITGGLSPAVLIVRELFYRACEFSMNYDLTKDEALALYKTHLQLVEKVVDAQTESGSKSIEGSLTESSSDGGDDPDSSDSESGP